MKKHALEPLHIGILFFMICAAYALIISRLFVVQIMHHSFYSTYAHKQYHITRTQYPPRAPIVDRTGSQYLAMNKDSMSAFMLPKQIKNREQLEQFLANHFPHALTRLHAHPDKNFLFVQRNLADAQIQCINASNCEDIYIVQEPSRYYPVPSTACIIGLTNRENKGLFGIEHTHNTALAGTPTTVVLEKDARSGRYYFTKDTTVSGCDGTVVQLTLDSDLQFLAQRELEATIHKFGAKEGSAIIMNPENGDILAMVNVPSFNPNDRSQLETGSTKIRALTEQYEFGSVFKIFAALAALEEGVVTPDEIIDCKNAKTAFVDGRRVNTVIPCGAIPFTDVIALSNNIGIAQVAKRLDEKLFDHYCMMGFGKKTGIDVPGECAGFVNGPYNWSKQSVISLSYGYEVLATILQLANAFCIIARDGSTVRPRICMDTPIQESSGSLYSPHALETIKNILRRTTQYGTAKRAQIKGYDVMSKTSTANMLINGTYNDQKNRYACAGIVQKGDYKRVIVVFVQEANRGNLYASTVVAPLLEKIAEHMLIHERII